MEKTKLDKSNWIAVVSAFVWSLKLIITFCILGQKESAFAIGSICFAWASVFYFCQYFIAKRPWQVLIGYFRGNGCFNNASEFYFNSSWSNIK